MKVVAFSIKNFEKAFLARANTKKHDITLISNTLTPETAVFAEGKEAVSVFVTDELSEKVITMLAGYGVKYLLTRSVSTNHIDKKTAEMFGMQIANIPDFPSALSNETLELIAEHTIETLDKWQEEKINKNHSRIKIL